MSCCLGPSVVRLESYINENSKGSFYLKNVTLQLGCSFVIFGHKTLGEIQSQILFFFFFFLVPLTKFLFHVIYAKAKIIGVTDMFLNPCAGEQ